MAIGTLLEAARPALVLRWGDPFDPLPLQTVRRGRTKPNMAAPAPPWWATGAANQPFDFCAHVRRLADDITLRSPDLAHVHTAQVIFAITQSRNSRAHGLQARVTPLRFHGGELTHHRRGTIYQVQRFFVGKRDVLYLVTFCLPRFLNLGFNEKLVTLFHELYHISPAFDGDLRRHNGRYSIHSHSQRLYDEHMSTLAQAYLHSGARPSLHAFLRKNFAQLQRQHGRVIGVCVPRPRIVPVPGANGR